MEEVPYNSIEITFSLFSFVYHIEVCVLIVVVVFTTLFLIISIFLRNNQLYYVAAFE
jgi:uncharacterized membrane protein affecting hemolysin expression